MNLPVVQTVEEPRQLDTGLLVILEEPAPRGIDRAGGAPPPPAPPARQRRRDRPERPDSSALWAGMLLISIGVLLVLIGQGMVHRASTGSE